MIGLALSGINLVEFQSFFGGLTGAGLLCAYTQSCVSYYKTSGEKSTFPSWVYYFWAVIVTILCVYSSFSDLMGLYSKEDN